jgi:lipoprotein-releasing system ATP-binding protein
LAALLLGNCARDRSGLYRELRSGAARGKASAGRHFAGLEFMNGGISLSCRDLERYLGKEEERVHALRGVSLQIEAGSLHAVVGPSGCGKSTLLYILGLLDVPDAGSVEIGSTSISHLSDEELARRRNELIGFIFQFHFLMEDFSAQENVMIPMRRFGQMTESDMRERAAALLEAVDLGDKLRRLSRHLSGGEQQRVAIARALANDPHVILADEPTGNLDTNNSQRAFELLGNLVRERNRALLLVTHNRFIADACDWVHEMKDGRIIASHPHGERISV